MSTELSPRRYLSVDELSQVLRMSTKWCYQALAEGHFTPAAFKIKGQWFIDKEQLEQLLKELGRLPKVSIKCQCGGTCECKTPCGNCAKALGDGDRHSLLCV